MCGVIKSMVWVAVLFTMANMCRGDVTVAPLFSDGMVLQRDAAVPVWGTAANGEAVTVEFCGQKVNTVADAQGKWCAKLTSLKPGGPWPLKISGKNTIEFAQVFVGDVWLCGGQSNMDMVLVACDKADEAMASITPNMHLSWGGGWSLASKQNNGGFSGTGYWFGRYLAEAMTNLHFGFIKCAVGGSSAESWTPEAVLKEKGMRGGELFRDRLKPLIPFALKGVAWYQGEANTDQPQRYSQAMETMIAAWRKEFENPNLPFVCMQLPRIGGPPQDANMVEPRDGWALTREAQTFNLSISNTAMGIYSETTDGDLHPKNKKDAGTRLALAALAKVYGRTPVENYCSPVLSKATMKNGMLTLSFNNAANGLRMKDPGDAIRQLAVISAGGTQAPAKAVLKGSTIEIDLRGEKGLPEVYYNFNHYPMGNLYNGAGLPVAPFRLAKLKIGVEDCIGDTVTLSQDVPFGAYALNPASYRIAGYKVVKASYFQSSAFVQLKVDKPWKIGDKIIVELPGFKEWYGAMVVAPIEFVATPGRVAASGCFKEMLVGELHTNVDFGTSLKTNIVDVRKLEYPSTKTWKLAQGDGTISLLDSLAKVDNALGFAHVYVYSANDAVVNLWCGTDDGARVYVNKELVCTSEGIRPCIPDFLKIKDVKLRKGWNSILFEISQGAGGWAVMARVVDDNGKPVMGIGYQAERPADFK